MVKDKRFSDLIDAALKRRTQARLADLLICSQQTVSDYRSGKSVPSKTRRRHIARVLRVSEAQLNRAIDLQVQRDGAA